MERRLVYTIALKFLALLGVVIVMAVMINSLFPVKQYAEDVKHTSKTPVVENVEVALDSLFAGKMLQIQWTGGAVAIVKRIEPAAEFVPGEPLNPQWRSVNAAYFVFYNSVGVARCPLYLYPDGLKLKDTCSGILYDLSGRRIEGQGEPLQIPPHYFPSDDVIVIGQWEAGK